MIKQNKRGYRMLTFAKGDQRRHYWGPPTTIEAAYRAVGIGSGQENQWRVILAVNWPTEESIRIVG